MITRNRAALLAIALALVMAACSPKADEAQPAAGQAVTPVAESQAPPNPAGAPVQGAAAESPAAATPPPPANPVILLAEGTTIRVRTTRALSTRTETPGEAFEATLAEPLTAGGQVVAPKGATATGVVAASDPGGRVQGRAHLAVRLTRIQLDDGRDLDIHTTTVTRMAPATKKKDAMQVGIASGVGAAIGAIAGGGRGAAIGAGVGAGAGTGAVMATRGAPAVIGAETLLTFRLQSPVEIRR